MKETITTEFALNDDYWAASLRTLYKYKRPFRYYQPWIGLVVLMCGVVLAVLLHGRLFTPVAIMIVGVIEMIEPFITKWKFMRDFRSNPSRGGTISVEFGDETFKIKTPNSEGEMKWSAALEVLQTPAGLMVFPQKRLHYFIPAEAFKSAENMSEVSKRFQDASVKTKIIDPSHPCYRRGSRASA